MIKSFLKSLLVGIFDDDAPQSFILWSAILALFSLIILLFPILLAAMVIGAFFSLFGMNGNSYTPPTPVNLYQEVIYEKAPCNMDAMGIAKITMLETTLFPSQDSTSKYDKDGNEKKLTEQQKQEREDFYLRLQKYYIHIFENQSDIKHTKYCILRPTSDIYTNLLTDRVVSAQQVKKSKQTLATQQLTLFRFPVKEKTVITTYAPSYLYHPQDTPTSEKDGFRYFESTKLSGGHPTESHFHMAVDLASYGNTTPNVYAFFDGEVVEIRNDVEDNLVGVVPNYIVENSDLWCGNRVKVKSVYPNTEVEFTQSYCHLKQNSVVVKVGDRITKGQLMARLGNSGYSTGYHLHFGISGDLQKHWKHVTGGHNLINPMHILDFDLQEEYEHHFQEEKQQDNSMLP